MARYELKFRLPQRIQSDYESAGATLLRRNGLTKGIKINSRIKHNFFFEGSIKLLLVHD